MSRAVAVAMGAIELDMTDGTRRRAELDAAQAMTVMEALAGSGKKATRKRSRRMTRADDLRAWTLARRGRTHAYIAAVLGVSERSVAGAIRRVECGRYGEIGDEP